jgi:hypothetical protein
MVLCAAALASVAAADPIGDYCELLRDRMHFCMAAFFGPEKSADAQSECALAPEQIEGKLHDALDALPAQGPERDTVEQSYFALVLYVDSFPRVKMAHALSNEELNRLPPIVIQACD